MSRKMREIAFRDEQLARLRARHIEPVNALVDRLRNPQAGLWAPYVAPMYGGVGARLLSVLRDPGPKTNLDHGGSGFLCMENDDPTAERISGLFAGADIAAEDVVPWNVYPWYINAAPNAAQLDAGVGPLMELIGLLPQLRVVMLHGGSAAAGWKKLTKRHPTLVADHSLTVVGTYHTSRQAFWHPDPAERDRRHDHLKAAFQQAADVLHETT
jgi:hypothetical protein